MTIVNVSTSQDEMSNQADDRALTTAQRFGREQFHAMKSRGYTKEQIQQIFSASNISVAVAVADFAKEISQKGKTLADVELIRKRLERSMLPIDTLRECFPDWEVPSNFADPSRVLTFVDGVVEVFRIGFPKDLHT